MNRIVSMVSVIVLFAALGCKEKKAPLSNQPQPNQFTVTEISPTVYEVAINYHFFEQNPRRCEIQSTASVLHEGLKEISTSHTVENITPVLGNNGCGYPGTITIALMVNVAKQQK